MNNDKRALVYIHIFADGSKYFGNAVNPNRPFDFVNVRSAGYLDHVRKFGEPIVQIRRGLTIVEADSLERWLFDRYISNGGTKLQKRPNGKDLAIVTKVRSEETRAKLKGNMHALGHKHTDETRAKISIGNKGRKLTEAHKKAISKAMRKK